MTPTFSNPVAMLIPDVVALNSDRNPSGSFYVYADPESSEIVTITHMEFGRATHRAANLLRPVREGPDGQVVALLALSDTVLYHAVLVGLMTANFIPFPISSRNSPAGIFQLLRASSCHRMLATCVTLAPLLTAIRKHIAAVDPNFALTIDEIPSLGHIYPSIGLETLDYPFHPYPTLIPRPSLDDIGLYMHSSGTSVAETRDYVEKPIGSMALPAFHLFAILCQLFHPLFGTCAAVYPPTATSPTALPILPSPDNILDHARKTKCRSISVVPSMLATWANSPPAIAYLKTLHTIIWGGGPLPQRTGDALLEAGLKLRIGYGATEIGAISTVMQNDGDERDWAWFRVSDLVRVRWASQGDGTFECQVLAWEKHAPMVENLKDVKGYATSDLCVNHPQKKHLWKVVGRVDDAIVHTSGEKTVPAPMEDIVTSSPHVAGAVMFGTCKSTSKTQPNWQSFVINSGKIFLYLITLPTDPSDFRPIIEEANEIAPTFSRIFKEMILFTSPGKSLPRAGKGTVLRKAAIALYAPEIDSIYDTVEEQISGVDSIEPPAVWEIAAIQQWLLELATKVCNSTTLSPTADLRHQGFDSLTATVFRLHIMRALRSQEDLTLARVANAMPQDLVYAHPTIALLAAYLDGLVRGDMTGKANADVPMEDFVVADETIPSTSQETIVELCSGPGIPLIVFPGAPGRVDPLLALRTHFSGALWGIQVTESAPTTPFATLTAFLLEKIREKQPNGPYRLAAYCASSVIVVAVAKSLEESGEHVLQLSFIDQFPLWWTNEDAEVSLRELELSSVVERFIPSMIAMLRRDPLYSGSATIQYLEDTLSKSPELAARTRRLNTPLLQFLIDFYPQNGQRSSSDFTDAFSSWVSSVKAPLSVLIAEFGLITTLPTNMRGAWADLGAHRCRKSVRLHVITGVGHFGILADKRTATFLGQY
ncbi:hypothetical protein B0H11DRAFT_2434130 [Mycena galericulata]|nr:hypothetical protein B0H11DRAFT_2434130 [Mycena galericulata]